MAETSRTPRLDGIRETLRDPLQILVQELETHLGKNLRSITVVGSALTDDFQPGVSDINTVVLLNTQDTASLNAVASLAKSFNKQRLSPPLLMTPFYIERSRDVFGVEFLDFQLTHETIVGDDPFAAIQVEKPDVRLQCERELKAMLVRLRQGYVAAAGDTELVRDVLIATAKGLAPVTRAMLWLDGVERPRTMEMALQKAGAHVNVDLSSAVTAERWRYTNPRLTQSEVEKTFTALLDAVEQLTTTIDGMKL